MLYGEGVMMNTAPEPLRQNKANSGRCRVGRGLGDERYGALYKQSQFAPCGLGRPSPRPSALTLPPGTTASVQNKANFRTDRKGQEPTRPPVPTAWAIVRNKANSRPSGRPDGPGIRHRMPATSPVTDNLGKSLTGTTGCAIFTKLIDARVECGPRADCASEMPRLDRRACNRTVPRGAIRKSADGSTLSSNTLCSNWNWGSIHTRK